MYHPAEVRQVRAWLDRLGLKVLDIHASAGREKAWGAPDEYRREAGVELVANRVEMAAGLGAEEIGCSAYGKCVNLEVSVKAHPDLDEAAGVLGLPRSK